MPKLAPDVERLFGLARDLERIRDGDHPTDRDLATAPIINDWGLVARTTAALIGQVDGHPQIMDGRSARSSDLFFLAPELGYARTATRFYVLGQRLRLSDRWDFR